MAIVGGVSLNRRLREKMTQMASKKSMALLFAEPQYCTDNAAMVAGLAFHKLSNLMTPEESMMMDADPNLGIGE